jgi:hypothetical protein
LMGKYLRVGILLCLDLKLLEIRTLITQANINMQIPILRTN